MKARVTVVGAGFAGVECAWTLARHGVPVRLYEMRPKTMTPAHTTGHFAELVCSNSLKSNRDDSPAGQLKNEMRGLGSIVLDVAARHAVPGGEALCVDRDAFGAELTRLLQEHSQIEIVPEEFGPDELEAALARGELVVLASGPLTSERLSGWLASATGRKHLHFYDAVSPTVDASTINRVVAFAQSRYDKGGDDYLNCPFNRDEYEAFVTALVTAERVPIRAFEAGGKRDGDPEGLEAQLIEKIQYFSGCTPIEAIAEKGARSLAFGNFKPVGLTDPRTGRRPYAALQLRPENRERTMYSLVACQNRLKWGEQRRVFRMVPGLEHAEFVRYGVIHRNTYIDAPRTLTPTLELRDRPGVFVSGQLTGVEGYVESAAMGIFSGYAVLARLGGEEWLPPGPACAYGCLMSHLMDDTPRDFAPMNINWGLFPAGAEIRDKAVRRTAKLEGARQAYDAWHAALRGQGWQVAESPFANVWHETAPVNVVHTNGDL
ncbi:MAG: methylenetetrahydrofolate--tRNA-(uracil(54)-C(5))-methyltransferase (FADH(2)-oxidizing) TrmFO [Fimbriimonadaceae bacterium]|nr:methylenetetrahydrofolate--tRNA-(uracil(54)-C(5))-methyltransferase (FADH(2)-oxidizing) TrmFO [Fimbriimonadaceae bacterium]